MLQRQRILLRKVKNTDIAERLALGRDAEIVHMFGGSKKDALLPLTESDVTQWFEGLNNNPYAWVIKHDGKFLGEIRLDNLNKHDQKARLAIGLFDASKLNKGIGTEATQLLLAYAFNELKLNRIDLRVIAYNTRAIKCYQKCGFVIEGVERESAIIDNIHYDDVIMSILASEFGK